MKIIVCVDDNFGMMFNHRRQTKDSAVINDIIHMTGDSKLFVNEYSSALFMNIQNVVISPDIPSEITAHDYCFIETQNLNYFTAPLEEIILYKWNRVYPADFYFNTDLLSSMAMETTVKFSGTSHPEIVKEIYVKSK